MVDVVSELIQANSEKKGIIITDHNYQSVIKISTKLVLLKEGKTHHLKHHEDLIEKGYLTSLY